jgi:uncharacterized protein (DUF924 family)
MRQQLYQICFYDHDNLSIVFEEQFPLDDAKKACKNACTAYVSLYHEIENGFAADFDKRKWTYEAIPMAYYESLATLNEKVKWYDDNLSEDRIKYEKYKHEVRELYLRFIHLAESKGTDWTKQPGFSKIKQYAWDLGY